MKIQRFQCSTRVNQNYDTSLFTINRFNKHTLRLKKLEKRSFDDRLSPTTAT